MADYPTSIYSGTTLVDGVDYPQATHINTLRAEITAIETALGTTATPLLVVTPGTSGNVLTSNGTAWTSAAATSGLPTDGWNSITVGAATRTAATTFTTTTDLTSTLKKGHKLKFTDTTTKYAYVIALSAYSAGSMTVTISGNALVGNPSAFYYSPVENPFGFPAYFTYTPTVTANAGSFTTVSATGRFYINGGICTTVAVITITTNGTASGFTNVTLPFNNSAIDASGFGAETQAVGFVARVDSLASASVLRFTKYDGSYLGGNSYIVTVTILYAY